MFQLLDSENIGDQSSYKETLRTPNVASDRKPYKGQEFDNLEKNFAFYNKYTKEAGFKVRIHFSRRSKDSNDILRKEYMCFKEGKSSVYVGSESNRHRPLIRDSCSAKLAVVKSKSSKYVVSISVEKHNHSLTTPRRRHLLRSHRSVSKVKKCLSQQFASINIPTHQ